ncbi:23913_t:CDS:1, partial [Racocetra persica]
CGCYLFTNQQGEIIYIGKARNLKNRISSYWQKTPVSDYFQQQIQDFNIILTQNVKEALILEQNLIKKHQPRFNVLLKDSNYYPYLEITTEKNPRYKVVRKMDPQKKSSYFGPFPDGSKAREILQLLERLFPLAKCKGNLGKPCFYYTIGQCSGHCWQVVDKSYYEKTRKQIGQFFQGQTQEIKKKILDSLRKNIKDLAFEIAQKEKKILDNIDFFTSKQNVEFQQSSDYDFLGIHYSELPASTAGGSENIITLFLLIYRYGKLTNTAEASFPVWADPDEVIQSYLYQFYQKNLPPQILYLPKTINGQDLLAEELSFRLEIARWGKKKAILKLAQQNAYQA